MDSETRLGFDPTRWTWVEALHAPEESTRANAAEALAKQYWPPVYAHLRSQGRSVDEATELTQAFFTDVVIGRKLLERADATRFRLRTLLLHALRKFLIDKHRRQQADPTRQALSLHHLKLEESINAGLRDNATSNDPGGMFDRRWAIVVLHEALSRCEQHLKAHGHERRWSLFDAYIMRPATSGVVAKPLQSLVEELGFQSYDEAASALRIVRKQLKQVFIRQIIAETNSKPEDQAAEYDLVMSLLP